MDEARDLKVSCEIRDLGAFRINSFNYVIENVDKLRSVSTVPLVHYYYVSI